MQIRKLNNQNLKRPRHALYCKIKNEAYFIPHFLAHYRALGIEHFYFVDDNSTDGTRETLLAQSDCTVIQADFKLSDQIDGVPGKNIVMRHVPARMIGPGWTLSADADEFLILPEGFATIGDLTRDLESRGEISCIGSMVDFYPRILAERNVDRTINPLEAFPLFDVGPYFLWAEGQLEPLALHAGVRHRINEWIYERDKRVWQVYRPTMLNKVPLIKWGNGMVPKTAHITNVAPYTGTQLVYAHFKFYPDLDIKVKEGVESQFYHGNSYYYRVLQHYLPIFDQRPLQALTTRRYTGPKDLQDANLLFANGRPF